jgi:hypothetical protein
LERHRLLFFIDILSNRAPVANGFPVGVEEDDLNVQVLLKPVCNIVSECYNLDRFMIVLLDVLDCVKEVAVPREKGDRLDIFHHGEMYELHSDGHVDLGLHLLLVLPLALAASETLLLVLPHVNLYTQLLESEVEHLVLGHAVVVVGRHEQDLVQGVTQEDLERFEKLLEFALFFQTEVRLKRFVEITDSNLKVSTIDDQDVAEVLSGGCRLWSSCHDRYFLMVILVRPTWIVRSLTVVLEDLLEWPELGRINLQNR